MSKLLKIFLILSIIGCTTVTPVKFDADWKIIKVKDENMACMPKKDVIKLREILINCGRPYGSF